MGSYMCRLKDLGFIGGGALVAGQTGLLIDAPYMNGAHIIVSGYGFMGTGSYLVKIVHWGTDNRIDIVGFSPTDPLLDEFPHSLSIASGTGATTNWNARNVINWWNGPYTPGTAYP